MVWSPRNSFFLDWFVYRIGLINPSAHPRFSGQYYLEIVWHVLLSIWWHSSSSSTRSSERNRQPVPWWQPSFFCPDSHETPRAPALFPRTLTKLRAEWVKHQDKKESAPSYENTTYPVPFWARTKHQEARQKIRMPGTRSHKRNRRQEACQKLWTPTRSN